MVVPPPEEDETPDEGEIPDDGDDEEVPVDDDPSDEDDPPTDRCGSDGVKCANLAPMTAAAAAMTTFEWPIPSYFSPIRKIAPEGKHLIFFLIAQEQLEAFEREVQAAGGVVTYSGHYAGLSTRPLLTDYTWNHTTLWAIKHDDAYTYLQCGFDPDRVREQMGEIREHFGDEVLFHMEFWKDGAGRMIPGAIPLVRFTTEERLNELIAFCRAIDVFVANPHVNNVEDGGRYREDNVQLAAKRRYDPKGLLNPGKMLSFEPQIEEAARL